MPLDITVLTARPRFVVVHFHIFKNAGTTIEHILEREFPGSFARLHGPVPEATLDAEDLAAFLRDQPAVRAVTSHHLRYPLPAVRNTVFFDCCFVRHPLDRLASLYSYYRRIESGEPLSRDARTLPPARFFRSLLDRAPQLIANVQVTQLASRGEFTRPAGQRDLEDALAIMRNMSLPGVVEMFEESMRAGEYFLRPAFPSIRLDAEPRNVGRPILAGPAERERRLIQDWGADLHRQLSRLNALDLELFEQTCHEIRRRSALIPPLPEQTAAFGERSLAAGSF